MRARLLCLCLMAWIGSSSCSLGQPFHPLDHRVVDAEYSQSLQRVVMVSAGPATLHLYDPVLRREETVALPTDPTSVGLSADGRFAAVGHDHLVSYVDLGAGAIVRTYPVSANLSDVVLADNGRLYAFRSTGQAYPGISVVDLETGTEQVVGDGGSRGCLRPGAQTLYVVNGHVFPEGRESYDISGGSAFLIHRSPFWGTHEYCGNLWFSEDGQRIFSACGETFRASSSRDQDMRFTGALPNTEGVRSLAHASSVHHVIAIPRSASVFGDPLTDTRLQLYHEWSLEYRGAMQLPSFAVDDQSFAAHGRFVFFDETLHFFVVIVQVDSAAGLSHDFAVLQAVFDPSAFTGAAGPTPPPVVEQPFPTFDRPIEDAKYDTALDRIVFVSSDSNLLHVLDPETGDDRQVPLPFAPNSVSLSPAGDRAAVGHDGGHVSVVGLGPPALLATYPARGDVLDVVLTPDWVYEFPRPGGLSELYAIELATGSLERTVTLAIDGDSRATLDSTGASLYVGSTGQLLKIDISQRPPAYLRRRLASSPPFGICGDIWPSQDGLRIFTRCGGVYRSSTDPLIDLTVEGRLDGIGPVRDLTDSTAAGRIAAIPGIPDYDGFGFAVIPGGGWNGDRTADTRVKLYDTRTLGFQQDVALPPFTLGAMNAPARGRFVFFNRLGTRMYVIVESDPSAGLVNGFGIVSFDVP